MTDASEDSLEQVCDDLTQLLQDCEQVNVESHDRLVERALPRFCDRLIALDKCHTALVERLKVCEEALVDLQQHGHYLDHHEMQAIIKAALTETA